MNHAKDAGDGDPLGDGAYQKNVPGSAPNEGAVYSVVGNSSKNTGGLTQHPVMADWDNYEGSLVIDVDGLHLDGYFIDKDGIEKDHFQIVKGVAGVPVLSEFGRVSLVATMILLVSIGFGHSRLRRNWLRRLS